MQGHYRRARFVYPEFPIAVHQRGCCITFTLWSLRVILMLKIDKAGEDQVTSMLVSDRTTGVSRKFYFKEGVTQTEFIMTTEIYLPVLTILDHFTSAHLIQEGGPQL
ncbi:hypothetical protein PoB_007420900 [Plakobranchus ocellatus]|uniref:Uncharacterized protein n=1 Tax=Plakobranchus ocellatus TaxID=259542 RepID=A0AAV4DU63_9GAST|nr:hypothetical protein PoB_007420900 [Plakobranchus ocellatus]